jgi:hypothetical protein
MMTLLIGHLDLMSLKWPSSLWSYRPNYEWHFGKVMAVASFYHKIRISSDFHLNCSTPPNEILYHITIHPKTAIRMSFRQSCSRTSKVSTKSKSFLIKPKKTRRTAIIYGNRCNYCSPADRRRGLLGSTVCGRWTARYWWQIWSRGAWMLFPLLRSSLGGHVIF